MRIHIVISDPVEGSSIGEFQWREDLDDAKACFRAQRGISWVTTLWVDVDCPHDSIEDITAWVDHYYWDAPEDRESVFGTPARVHKVVKL